ncbi:BMP family ABC transporter substrate-binding protein [Candidatus Bathyarchaeota archaeon]|nr:BMP family ABC transporter substrate-binding protein [Candidatus Bathyarchaeota archaeon]
MKKVLRQKLEMLTRGVEVKKSQTLIIVIAVIAVVIIAGVAYILLSGPVAPTVKKIGLITGTGGLGDKSFNDIAYAGALLAKDDFGIELDYNQPTAIAEYEGIQIDYAETGEYALIICVGFDQVDALTNTAEAYPEQKFAIVDAVVDKPNVASLLFKANEGSFLTGVIAGMMTETGKIGFVGGMDIPLIQDFRVGYEAGAEWSNPDVEILSPIFVGDWGDPAKGKELAVSLIDLGADAIFAAAGGSGLGALEAVNQESIIGFGVDSCQDYLYPEIVASMTKRVDIAVYEMIEAAIDGDFAGGIYEKGVADGWTGCSRLPEEEEFWEETFNFEETPLDAAVLSKLIEAKDGIIDGTITVPSIYD